jgi:hypothetical protein
MSEVSGVDLTLLPVESQINLPECLTGIPGGHKLHFEVVHVLVTRHFREKRHDAD